MTAPDRIATLADRHPFERQWPPALSRSQGRAGTARPKASYYLRL